MAENNRFQLRSYVAALGTEQADSLLANVQKAFEEWSETDSALLDKNLIKFFSAETEEVLKVFALIPLVDDETKVLEATWVPELKATMQDDLTIKLQPKAAAAGNQS